MATITAQRLAIAHNVVNRTARCTVTGTINFTQLERFLMAQGLRFKLKAELWGDDSGLTGSDDKLFTYTPAKYFPDANPAPNENVTFDVTLGEGVLDEDGFLGGYVDEVYGKLVLTNLYTSVTVSKSTNVVSHSF
jgi:hypothetical protein